MDEREENNGNERNDDKYVSDEKRWKILGPGEEIKKD